MLICNVCGVDQMDTGGSLHNFFTSKYSRITICGNCCGTIIEEASLSEGDISSIIESTIVALADSFRDADGKLTEESK